MDHGWVGESSGTTVTAFLFRNPGAYCRQPARWRPFPSGYTSQAFFIATLVDLHFHVRAWVVFLMYTITLLLGITRMYVGAALQAGRAGGDDPGHCLGTSTGSY